MILEAVVGAFLVVFGVGAVILFIILCELLHYLRVCVWTRMCRPGVHVNTIRYIATCMRYAYYSTCVYTTYTMSCMYILYAHASIEEFTGEGTLTFGSTPIPAGWGLVWKLLLSRLGLFREMFADLRGEKKDNRETSCARGKERTPKATSTPFRARHTTGGVGRLRSGVGRLRSGLDSHTHTSTEPD